MVIVLSHLLATASGQSYTWNANGNLLNTGSLTNTFDAANRLITTQRATTTLQVAYNGLNDRVAQTVGVTTTNFVLDVAAGLPEVISTTNGTTYLHLPGLIMAQNAAGQRVYLLSDGLGSIRQVISGTTLVSQRDFDPYGNPSGATAFSDPYGFTGEWWEKDVKLLHLRARWYDAGSGIFLSKDPVESEPPYLYAGGNPINVTDPTGMWQWRRPGGVAAKFHLWAEEWYEGMGGQNPSKHLEYSLFNRVGIRPDMFNSVMGDVYEIEPIYKAALAFPEAWGYTVALNFQARNGNLQGFFRQGQPYNWNSTSFHVGTGVDWPRQLRVPMAGGQVTYVADYVGPGTVLYWLELNGLVVPVPIRVHDKRLIKPPNFNPQLAWQPAYVVSGSSAFYAACGYVLVFVGGTIIAVTIVEDVATAGIGTFDDAVTVPGGIWLINIGQRLAAFVPVATTPATSPGY